LRYTVVSRIVSLSHLFRCPPCAKRIFAVPPALLAQLAHAHVTESSTAASWNFEPWLIACLLLAALLYARGAWALWRKAGVGRGLTLAQACAFIAGWFTLWAALVSPLDALGGSLLAAHMVQHELLMVIAAPLFVCARPLEPGRGGCRHRGAGAPATPPTGRRCATRGVY
jgi:putative membrane protein